ncbi:manganese efflux pump [Alkalihalobacterium alkalinitrilicum]|uniref:manganese efflux pump n=1 Tax=Alkalihalobacterium alkalinitrilicum TaxID=427920 RepID=UPI000995B91D|nr:manganese efflux pump [Alkalihalobacterium alkalinitrilicum]
MDALAFIFSLFLLSIDGFIIGFIFGLKKIRIAISTLTIISIFTAFVMLIALFFGNIVGELIPTYAIKVFSGILLITIGTYQLISDPPLYQPSFLIRLAIIINIDGLAYGVQAGLAGRSYSFAFFVGIFLFFAIVFGVVQGSTIKNRFITRYLAVLPGFIFIVLGISKFIF